MAEWNATIFNNNSKAAKVSIVPSKPWFNSVEILLLSALIATIWMCIDKWKLIKNMNFKKHLTTTLGSTVLFGLLTGGHWIISYFEGYFFYKLLLGVFYASVVSQFHYMRYGTR